MYQPKYVPTPTKKEIEQIAQIRKEIKGQLLPEDTNFQLDDYTIFRYLRHKDGKVPKVIRNLEATIAWRREFKPFAVTYDEVEKRIRELNTMFVCGLSKEGIPVIYIKPRACHLPKDYDIDVKVLCWYFEELNRRGYRETLTIVDVGDYGRMPTSDERKADEAIEAFAHAHYPLIDGKLLVMNLPLIMRPLMAISLALMGGAQRDATETGIKIKHLSKWIEPDQLPVGFGGIRKPCAYEDGTYNIKDGLDSLLAAPAPLTDAEKAAAAVAVAEADKEEAEPPVTIAEAPAAEGTSDEVASSTQSA